MRSRALSTLLIYFSTCCFAQEKMEVRVNWTEVTENNFCPISQPKNLSPKIFEDQRDISSKSERDSLCYQAFVEALNNLTYCYPDIKSGNLMGLDKTVRDNMPLKLGWNKVCKRFEDITYGESIIPSFPQMSYKYPYVRESNKGNSQGNVTIILKWKYVAVDRFDSAYSRLEFKYKTNIAKYTGCHCVFGDIDKGFKTYYKSECALKNQSGFECYSFKPEGFRDEVIEATIYIYPQIFETESFYFKGGGGEWINTRHRALMILFLHELGHLEQHVTQNVKFGDKVTVSENETYGDTFAYSVLRCVE